MSPDSAPDFTPGCDSEFPFFENCPDDPDEPPPPPPPPPPPAPPPPPFIPPEEKEYGGFYGVWTTVQTPDGSQTYALSPFSDSISLLFRDVGTGALTFDRHLVFGMPDGILDGPVDGVISDDGAYLYVNCIFESAIYVYARNTANGDLTLLQTVTDGVGGVDGIGGAYGIELSQDGNTIYVAGNYDNAVAVFNRNAISGLLTYVDNVNLTDDSIDALQLPRNVIVSDDDAFVYAYGELGDEIVEFSRNLTTGELTYTQTYPNRGLDANGELVSPTIPINDWKPSLGIYNLGIIQYFGEYAGDGRDIQLLKMSQLLVGFGGIVDVIETGEWFPSAKNANEEYYIHVNHNTLTVVVMDGSIANLPAGSNVTYIVTILGLGLLSAAILRRRFAR